MTRGVDYISLSEIVSDSIFSNLDKEHRVGTVSVKQVSIQYVEVKNVHFLPHSRVSVIDQKYFPEESGFDGVDLKIMQELKGHQKYSSVHKDDFRYFQGRYCLLCNPWSNVFSHWIEELCKVIVLENSGYLGIYVVPRKKPFVYETMKMLGVAKERILLSPMKASLFESVIYTERYNFNDAYRRPEVFSSLREKLLSNFDKPGVGKNRIWISRSSNRENEARQIVNIDQVDHILKAHDVVKVNLGDLSFEEQLRLISNTELLAGPHDSGFIHSLFMPKRSCVIECFSPFWLNPTWNSIYRMMEHKYFQIVPSHTEYVPYLYDKDVWVDPEQLDLSLYHSYSEFNNPI